MPVHWDQFKESGLTERKCIYLWDADTYNNGKYLMDLVYTKMFIHPRNAIFENRHKEIIENNPDDWDNDDLYIDFKKVGNKLTDSSGKYVVFEIDSDDIDSIGYWNHLQEPGGTNAGTTCIMDDKYAHSDKKLHITGNSIAVSNLKIVEEFDVRIYKNEKLGFSFKNNKNVL